jgi:hypothetical protein
MFYTNTTTLLLLHEDRVKELQKMHEPLPFFSRWSFRRKAKVQQTPSSSTATFKDIDMLKERKQT